MKSRLLENIGKIPLLSKKEEEELARQVQSGDGEKAKEALDRMTMCNIGLVVKIAHGFIYKGVPFEDLVSEGIIGLIKAIKHYDPSKGAKLSSYSAFWIKEQIRKYIIKSRGVITVPRKIPELKCHYEKLRQEGKSDEEIRKEMGHSRQFIQELKNRTRIYSIDQEYENGLSLIDKMPAAENRHDSDMEILFKTVMDSDLLSDMEKIVLTYRYGLNGTVAESLKMIARFMGRSSERVRQFEESAIWKLKREIG